MTRRSQVLERADSGPFIEINPDDAQKLRIKNGEQVRVMSRRGRIILPARVTAGISPGITFIPLIQYPKFLRPRSVQ
jgi:anaerobic selenocysteine-containing dehydrogenase